MSQMRAVKKESDGVVGMGGWVGGYLDKVVFDQLHFGELHSQRLQKEVGHVLGLHVLEAKVNEYLTVGFGRVQVVAALFDVRRVVVAPWLLAATVVRNEDLAAGFEPILSTRQIMSHRSKT